MNALKRIAVSIGLFVLLYSLLIVPWPGVRRGYGAFFHLVGNALLGSIGEDGSAQFSLAVPPHGQMDTKVLLSNRKTVTIAEMFIDSQLTGYRPTAVVIAFILATPIRWSRKWRALLVGLVLVNLFVVFRLVLQVVPEFGNDNSLAVFTLSPFWRRVVFQSTSAFVWAPASSYIVPIFIWAMVAFRRGDWVVLFPKKGPPGDAPDEETTGDTGNTPHSTAV